MDDGAALLRAICENPADDTARLVYADYLDGLDAVRIKCPEPVCEGIGHSNKFMRVVGWFPGKSTKSEITTTCSVCKGSGTVLDTRNSVRAEFIRLQIKLAQFDWNDCGGDLLRRREADLLASHEHTLAAPLGDVGWQANSTWVPECEWQFARGFACAIETSTNHLLNHPAIAQAFLCQPIERVTLPAKRPNRDQPDDTGVFSRLPVTYDFWHDPSEEPHDGAFHLPLVLFDELRAMFSDRIRDRDYVDNAAVFESATEADALGALSLAAVNLRRKAAGLTPLGAPKLLSPNGTLP